MWASAVSAASGFGRGHGGLLDVACGLRRIVRRDRPPPLRGPPWTRPLLFPLGSAGRRRAAPRSPRAPAGRRNASVGPARARRVGDANARAGRWCRGAAQRQLPIRCTRPSTWKADSRDGKRLPAELDRRAVGQLRGHARPRCPSSGAERRIEAAGSRRPASADRLGGERKRVVALACPARARPRSPASPRTGRRRHGARSLLARRPRGALVRRRRLPGGRRAASWPEDRHPAGAPRAEAPGARPPIVAATSWSPS